MTVLAIILAVLGACCGAVGAQLQHRAVRSATKGSGLRLRVVGRLIQNRRWLLGFAVLFAGSGLQILALAMAPITVVVPIVVLALPATAILNAYTSAQGLDRTAITAVVASTAGIAVFVALASTTAVAVTFPVSSLLLAIQIIGGIVVLSGLLGALQYGIARCMLLATGAGVGYGLVSVLIRDVTYTIQTDGIARVSPLSAIGLLGTFAISAWFIQLAYASGPPDVVVGCHTVLNPLVATAIAIWLLDEIPDAGGWTGAGLVCSALVAILGLVQLARHHPQVTSPLSRRHPRTVRSQQTTR
jgi:hypothetical protein